jgi:nitrogen fixation protein FixH
MARELTGRKVFVITASAFAVIIGVNILLTVKAVSTFPGVEVRNSYVASQTFESDRAAQEALGWTLTHTYADGRLTLAFADRAGQPVRVARLEVLVGRTTEAADDQRPAFAHAGGAYSAPVALGPGRWLLLVEAEAADGTKFRQRLGLFVKG